MGPILLNSPCSILQVCSEKISTLQHLHVSAYVCIHAYGQINAWFERLRQTTGNNVAASAVTSQLVKVIKAMRSEKADEMAICNRHSKENAAL